MAKFQGFTSAHPINRDLGLLIIRLGVGFSMMLFHGFDKISGGPELWRGLGAATQNLGFDFAPVFWGFMAAFAEFVCSILVVLGVMFRPAAALLAINMLVAVLFHLNMPAGAANAGWSGASHALELLAVYVGFLLIGPGRYAFSLMTRREGPRA